MVRIGGLASGMDIDQLVSDLMKAERIPLDKMEQKKQLLEWQRDDYREMNKLLFDLDSEAFNMTLSSNFKVKNVTTTNDAKVTATASPSAGNTTYSITQVDRLATSAYNVGTASVTVNTTDNLWTQYNSGNMTGVTWDDTFVDTVNVATTGKEFSLSNKNLVAGSIGTINVVSSDGASSQTYTKVTNLADLSTTPNSVYVDEATGKLTFSSNLDAGSRIETSYQFNYKSSTTVSTDNFTSMNLGKAGINQFSLSITDSSGADVTGSITYTINKDTGEITFNSAVPKDYKVDVSYTTNTFDFSLTTYDNNGNQVKQTFNIEGNSTLSTVTGMINGSRVGVSGFYDGTTQTFALNRSQTGDMNPAEIDPTTGLVDPTTGYEMEFSGAFLTNVLKLDQTKEQGGEDASFTLNGLATTRHTNTFDINGVTFTLKDTFTSSEAPVTVSTTTDVDKVYENIKSFIDKYNELIEKVNGELREERYRSYQPLTSAQRKDMEENEIKLWEEKAKSGMLKNDSILQSGLYQMRNDFYSRVATGGLYNHISEIGIKTSPDFMSGGKLVISESELKKAISTDPDAVYKLFVGDDSGDSEGLIKRLRDTMDATMDKIENKAGNSGAVNNSFLLGKNLDDLGDRMNAFEDRLVQIEDRYWRQFTAMEKAIQRSNQQSVFLMNQFGGGM